MKNLLKFAAFLAVIVVVGFGGYEVFKAEQPSVSYGAAAGPDSTGSDSYSWNGVRLYPFNTKVRVATTTLCTYKSPNATTTLRYFAVNLTTSSSSASTLYLAKGTTQGATTTNFETAAIASNAEATVIASTTGRTNGLPIISPNTWLTAGINFGAAVGVGTAPIGTCSLELQSV